MKRLIIGVSNYMPEDFSLLSESLDEQFNRTLKPLEHVELTDVGAAIITSSDIKAGLHKIISETGYGIPGLCCVNRWNQIQSLRSDRLHSF
ncbi:hypothetical protein, partial [Vibrio jasicida]|uniref:hypothetical protein n=1 Tax=Vibrio jasicida TaxID=766224 RepID=UPI002158837B